MDLMQTQNKVFTNTLNQQQTLLTKLQANMDKISKEQNKMFWTSQGITRWHVLLIKNANLDVMGKVIMQKMDKMMQRIDKQVDGCGSTEEEKEKMVEDTANLLLD